MTIPVRPRSKSISPKATSLIIKLALGLLIVVVLVSGIFFARRAGADPQSYSNDFNVYYFAAIEVLAGRDPYQNSIGAWTPYLYPPLLAEVMTPLVMLPLFAAAYVWFLINAAATATAAAMSAKLVCQQDESPNRNHRPPTALVAVASLVMLTRFTLSNFDMGQVNTLVIALAVAHVYLYRKQRRLASALILAIAISIKVTPAILILYHVARRRWIFSASTAAMTAALMAASFLPFGQSAPQAFDTFVSRTIKNEQGFDLAFHGNQSLRGASLRIADETAQDHRQIIGGESSRKPTDGVALILSFILVALAFLTAARATGEVAAAAPFFCVMVMVSPLSWKEHFFALLLPVAYLVYQMLWSARPLQRKLLATVLAIAFLCFNVTSHKLIGVGAGDWAEAHSFITAAALLIYAASLRPYKFGKQPNGLLSSTGRAGGL
jgi:alpha-1,2-mannosyltransferase